MRAQYLLIALSVISLFLAVSSVHATSVSATFDTLNSSVGINQNVVFNISAYYAQNSSYVVLLNNTPVLSGKIPAAFSGYTLAKLNVSNTLFGNYKPCIRFSFITGEICANSTFYIVPTTNFGFLAHSNYTLLYNNSSTLDISLIDSGNTPIDVTWSLPNIAGVHFSLLYMQSFSMTPGKIESIPINISSTASQPEIMNFSFIANFSQYSVRNNYLSTLISPRVNINFTGFNVINQINSNESEYQINISDSNNIPINVTFEFELCIVSNGQCNVFFYNKSVPVSSSSKHINITLPNSSVLSVRAMYPSSNGSMVSTQIFSGQAPQGGNITNPLMSYTDMAYIALTAAIIIMIAIMHLRAKKGTPKLGGKK